MMPSLADYLDAVTGRDFAYGTLDCAILMADWLMLNGCRDPMADRRGTYASERAYRAAIRSEGGIVASCRRRFAAIGLRQAVTPVAGDVAIVLAPYGERRGRLLCRPTGSIMDGASAAVVLDRPRGIVCAPLPVVMAWTFCALGDHRA